MRNIQMITISSLLAVGLLPATLSAQTRLGKSEMRAHTVRVETRMHGHQAAAAVESAEEHPTEPKTADVGRQPESKSRNAGKSEFRLSSHAESATSPFAVALVGNTSWSISNNTVNMKVDKITHDGNGTTGSLRLRLWATQSAYQGGGLNGYVLGTYQFQSQLTPGQYFSNVNVTVPFTAPPDGNYYVTMTLEEYLDTGWYIMNYATYNSTHNFGGGTPANSQLSLQGTSSWQVQNSVLNLKVDKVANNGGGTTGSLQMRLWATDSTFGGGTIRGYVLGSYQFSRQLAPHEYFYGIDVQVPFAAPPDGTYHTTLTLEEYTGSGWVIRDYLSFNSTTTFGNPSNNGDPCSYREINTYGDPISGLLTSGSCLNSGYRVDAYKFFAVAGMQIQIVMASSDFYTFQALFGPGGDLVASAAEGFADGRTVITITAPATGVYGLMAASNDPSSGGPGWVGQYSLSVRVN